MSRLMIPFMVGALLSATAVVRAGEVEKTAALTTLHGPNAADCAQTNSDYERYELGCPIDNAAVRPLASAETASD